MFIRDIDLKLQDWQFAQRKYLPYEAKLKLSAARIRDWYDYYDGMVHASFSGGLDSTVMVHMLEKVLGEKIPLVFVDTGLEFPQIKEFVQRFDNVIVLKPEMNFREVIRKYGYPLISKETACKIRKLRNSDLSERYRNYLLYGDERGSYGKLAECWKFLLDAPFEISEKCCEVMKKKPLKKYQKETGRVPYIGITQDEGFMRQRKYNKTGCNVYNANDPKSQPMGFWRRQDVLRYVIKNDLEICSVYGDILQDDTGNYYTTGEQRTGCVYCAMGCHLEEEPNRYQRLKIIDKSMYDFVMRPYIEGGLGFDYVLNYCDFAH